MNKKILFILNGTNLSGVTFDYVDLYYNLSNLGYDIKLIMLINKKEIVWFSKLILKSFSLKVFKTIHNALYTIDDDKKLNRLFDSIKNYNIIFSPLSFLVDRNLNLQNKNIISYINLRTYLYLVDNSTESEKIKNLCISNNIHYLITSFASKITEQLKCNKYIYYSKLSEFRLNNIKINNNKLIYTNKTYENNKNDIKFNLHDYNELNFYRRNDFNKDLYIEIKGKSIFEFLYHNKKVYYNALPQTYHDGLADYLNYLNINSDISQYISINRNELINKMIKFDYNDFIIKLIEGI